MKILFEDNEVEIILKDIFQNLPEYGVYSFRCTKYDYDNFIYELYDGEEDKEYTIDLEKAKKGFLLFASDLADKKIHFCGLGVMELLDGSCYDAIALDAVIQYSLFGKLIYG